MHETEQNQSLNFSQTSEKREELFPVNADTAVVGDLSPPFVPKHKCPSYLCSKFRCPKETEKQKRTLYSVNKVQSCTISYELF